MTQHNLRLWHCACDVAVYSCNTNALLSIVPFDLGIKVWSTTRPRYALYNRCNVYMAGILLQTDQTDYLVLTFGEHRRDEAYYFGIGQERITDITPQYTKYACINGQCVLDSRGIFTSLDECRAKCRPIDGSGCNCPPPSVCLSYSEAMKIRDALARTRRLLEG